MNVCVCIKVVMVTQVWGREGVVREKHSFGMGVNNDSAKTRQST